MNGQTTMDPNGLAWNAMLKKLRSPVLGAEYDANGQITNLPGVGSSIADTLTQPKTIGFDFSKPASGGGYFDMFKSGISNLGTNLIDSIYKDPLQAAGLVVGGWAELENSKIRKKSEENKNALANRQQQFTEDMANKSVKLRNSQQAAYNASQGLAANYGMA